MLSETSWTTFHKVLACAMLSQKYEDNIDLDYFLCNVVWSLLDNIAQDLYLFNVGPWPTDYFYKENNPCNVLWPCWDNIAQCFYLLNVSSWPTDNFYKENILCNVILAMLGQHCIINVVQTRLRQHCTKNYLRKVAKGTQTCFYRKINYAMLSWSDWANFAQENYLCNVGPLCIGK